MNNSLFLDICRTNYRAVFEMLREAIEACPESLWYDRADEPAFWHQAYHTISSICFYLSDSPKSYKRPPFAKDTTGDLSKTQTNALSRQQVKEYLEMVSEKCEALLNKLASMPLDGENTFPWTGPTLAHRLIYNIRHAQHHVGWMNSILRRKAEQAAKWVI